MGEIAHEHTFPDGTDIGVLNILVWSLIQLHRRIVS